jgi:hypothetical protein
MIIPAMKTKNAIFGFIFLTSLLSFAYTGFPENTDTNNLFKIIRSRDSNEVIYDINLTPAGSLNISNPINIYWINKTENGSTEPLTRIQKKYAYGLKFMNVSDEKADFEFVSFLDRLFLIRKTDDNIYKVFTYTDDKKIEVSSLFILFKGSSWIPTILKVELHGIDTIDGSLVVETITTQTQN